jgi:cytidyltransferase-like protein
MIVRDSRQIHRQAELYREFNCAICLASGTFDWFHYGHLRYLLDARALPGLVRGDERNVALFVGINSDLSYVSFKGKEPKFSLEERAFMLDSIRGVDVVIPFNDADPGYLIDELRPNYYVKGNEYKLEDLPEGPALGRAGTMFIPRVPRPNYRTSELLREETNGSSRRD